MNLTPNKTEDMLFTEVLDVIHQYEDIVLLPTVLGILDIIKMKLVDEVINAPYEDEED